MCHLTRFGGFLVSQHPVAFGYSPCIIISSHYFTERGQGPPVMSLLKAQAHELPKLSRRNVFRLCTHVSLVHQFHVKCQAIKGESHFETLRIFMAFYGINNKSAILNPDLTKFLAIGENVTFDTTIKDVLIDEQALERPALNNKQLTLQDLRNLRERTHVMVFSVPPAVKRRFTNRCKLERINESELLIAFMRSFVAMQSLDDFLPLYVKGYKSELPT